MKPEIVYETITLETPYIVKDQALKVLFRGCWDYCLRHSNSNSGTKIFKNPKYSKYKKNYRIVK